MIKVILWDIDGTLLSFKSAERVAITRCFAEHGLGECTDEMLGVYSKINAGWWKRLELGEVTKPEVLLGRFKEFFARYGLPVEKAEAFNASYQVRLGETIVFNDSSKELVTELRGKVLQCAVTNGTLIAQRGKLKNSGLGELFDDIFISELVGHEKPDVRFFEAVWAKIGHFAPQEVLIVGDSLTGDMRGGNNAGILCCWYNPEGLENGAGVRLDYEIGNLQQVKEILAEREAK